jgi:hypothetical protein
MSFDPTLKKNHRKKKKESSIGQTADDHFNEAYESTKIRKQAWMDSTKPDVNESWPEESKIWFKEQPEQFRKFINAVLEIHAGNASQTAQELGVPPRQVLRLTCTRPFMDIFAYLNGISDNPILSREERMALWSEIATDPTVDAATKLRATELLGKAQGDFIERVEQTNRNINLDDVMKAIDAVSERVQTALPIKQEVPKIPVKPADLIGDIGDLDPGISLSDLEDAPMVKNG